jgi:hypothetical protein
VGFSVFAAVMMMMIGVFQALMGIAAIAKDEFFVVSSEYVFEFDVAVWGWIHLVVGALVVLAGFGIFTGNVLARTVGVFIALASAVAAFVWLPYQPVWSSIIIAIDVIVIWALTVHGRDIAEG